MFFSHGLCLMFLALALTIAPETKISQNLHFNRPPKHAQTQSGNTTPISTPSTPLRTPNEGPSVQNSPGNPLAFVSGHRRYRSGYEVQPKATPYKPYALNNPGIPTQGAFNLSKETSLEAINALDPWQYTELAVKAKLLPLDCAVHSFQVETSNIVLMRRTDTVVIAPTGYGESLTWTLPLLACREGISLVITPFTSLGQEGELFEQNSQQDFEAAASGEMVLYVCLEMLENYKLINLGNFRPELSTIIVHMGHEIRSFNDIATWMLGFQFEQTIVYCDDIELLTEMFCAGMKVIRAQFSVSVPEVVIPAHSAQERVKDLRRLKRDVG
ncbi:hypothetical protein B0H14DRAFT_2617603 [Mycena olivaceomarginata]|nr:hypothetical protein B0H14DRAFT_2617603 [Mycena olivaceomarginata]